MMEARVIPIDFGGVVWAYLYVCGERLSLIDSGIAGQVGRVEDVVRAAGLQLPQLSQIVLTHCHEDHVGAVAELQERTEALTLAHRLDVPVIRGDTKAPPPVMADWEKKLHEQIAGNVPPALPARVDVELEDGQPIDLGDEAVVIHVPGHTDGSVAIYVPSQGTLFTGDAVASVGGRPIVGVFNVDPKRARDSFRMLAEREFETAYFGHGDPVRNGAAALMREVAESL